MLHLKSAARCSLQQPRSTCQQTSPPGAKLFQLQRQQQTRVPKSKNSLQIRNHQAPLCPNIQLQLPLIRCPRQHRALTCQIALPQFLPIHQQQQLMTRSRIKQLSFRSIALQQFLPIYQQQQQLVTRSRINQLSSKSTALPQFL